jgi:uncharacterized protein (TIGR02302 family)
MMFERRAKTRPQERREAPPGSPALERLVRRSLAALAVERAARVAAAILTLLLVFLALSFAGVWLEIGPRARLAGVLAFAAAAAFVLLRDMAKGPPRRRDALARIDGAPGAAHRLASSLEDDLAGERPDPATRALWTLHRRRLAERLASVTVAPPDPDLPRRDPLALRAAALVAAIAAAIAAGPDRMARLAAAFDFEGAGIEAGGGRIDAWLDPPAYTGRPPVVLPRRADAAAGPIAAPIHSTLIVRSFGSGAVAAASAGLAPLPAAPRRSGANEHEREERLELRGDAQLTLRGAGAFELAAIPDRAPTIASTEPPRGTARGALTLAYRIDDDYGVTAAEATAAPPAGRGGRSLYAPPRLALALPPTPAGLGEAKATLDFSDHPWAGAKVALTLVAHDEGGNHGASAPIEITLPERHFTQPLARALVEQRRNLALDPDHHARVRIAIDALALGAALFETPSAIFLGLDAARSRLERAHDDADLREVADLLWAMALSLEEGDASQAERELRAAQQELREALARGAGEEEIARLTEQLRNAMDAFLSSLAEKSERAAPGEDGRPSRSIGADELQAMLKEIEKAERAGDLAEAQRLLDDLQDILENLRPAQAGRPDPRAEAMTRALDEIDRLTREQQQLRDDTSRAEQRGQKGRPSGESEARSRQHALRDRLEREQERLRRSGEPAPQDFDDAEKAMKEAEQALGSSGREGQGRAVDAQGRALQSLRRGADQLVSRLQDGEGEDAQGGGSGMSRGRKAGLGQGEESDPLGRPSGRRRAQDSRARFDPLGLPPAVRARRVQEELRRRLGQPERPAEELDYYDRLLKR